MEKRTIDQSELDMEVQADHYGSKKKKANCTTGGKSTDCCWHDCTERREGGTGTAIIFCEKWATYMWSAFA